MKLAADLMAFLAGGRADYITGVTVTIAGGKSLSFGLFVE